CSPPPGSGECQEVEAPGEYRGASHETPTRCAERSRGPAFEEKGDGKQGECVIHLVAGTRLEYGEQVGREPASKAVGAERPSHDRQPAEHTAQDPQGSTHPGGVPRSRSGGRARSVRSIR